MRNYAKAFFAFAMLGMVGACADNAPVAPVASAPTVSAPANFLQIGNTVVFRVNNQEGITKTIGSHVISMPANSICDLLTSGYGQAFWDKSCTPLKGSIIITATVFAGPNGQPYIDFQPAMRFAPNKNVMLFFREGRNDGTKLTSVKYCNNLGYCVDESLTDASLKPFRIGTSSIIGRRLKHFSGYVVAYEWECPGTATPNGEGQYYCEEGGGGFTRRSGYMVASGEDITDVMKDPQDDKATKSDEKHQEQQ